MLSLLMCSLVKVSGKSQGCIGHPKYISRYPIIRNNMAYQRWLLTQQFVKEYNSDPQYTYCQLQYAIRISKSSVLTSCSSSPQCILPYTQWFTFHNAWGHYSSTLTHTLNRHRCSCDSVTSFVYYDYLMNRSCHFYDKVKRIENGFHCCKKLLLNNARLNRILLSVGSTRHPPKVLPAYPESFPSSREGMVEGLTPPLDF